MKIAERDLVPMGVDLRPACSSFGNLESACEEFMTEVHTRIHRETRRAPVEILGEERFRLHRVPEHPYTAALGTTRQVHERDSTIRVEQVRYSVPHQHAGRQVFVRWHGEELVVTAILDGAPAEIARHHRSTPGTPVIIDEHYPESARGVRVPRPRSAAEEAFLVIGEGAAAWLEEAAATGVRGIQAKMAEAVSLAKLRGAGEVDRALGTAAIAGRFSDSDLRAILEHQAHQEGPASPNRAGESHSRQPGTSAWSRFGTAL